MISASSLLTSFHSADPFELPQRVIVDVLVITGQSLAIAIVLILIPMAMLSLDHVLKSKKPTLMGRILEAPAFTVQAWVFGWLGVVLIFVIVLSIKVIDALQRASPDQVVWTIVLSVAAFVVVLLIIAAFMASAMVRLTAQDDQEELATIDDVYDKLDEAS